MIRTRFAPSPTGFMHVGGVRTALFAWLVARQSSGKFVLRIEDTDQSREIAGAEDHIIKSLKALGLDYDEGPDIGGQFAPYRQSERLDNYKKWAEKLISAGRAYADPYSSEQVQAFREEAQKNKQPFLYRNHRPDNPPAWNGSTPLRFKSEPKAYTWQDAVMGDLSTGPEAVDDFVLIKSDGFPTYNFAHIVDDAEMQITHIIRGQEFLASVPNYLNLYEALGLDQPILATVPHILAPEGNKKLSKRDGAKDVLKYIEEGFLPEALVNFIVSLGWNDGTEQEMFSIEELKSKFSLDRVQKSGARFDEKRLLWMNGQFINKLSLDDLYEKAGMFWGEEAKDADSNLKRRVLEINKDRLKKLSDLPQITHYIFKLGKSAEDVSREIDSLFNVYGGPSESPKPAEWLNEIIALIDTSESDDPKSYEEQIKKLIEKTPGQPMTLYGALRVALTGADQSPPVWELIYILGKEESTERLKRAVSGLGK